MSSARGVLVFAALAVLSTGSSAQQADVRQLQERVETLRALHRDEARRANQYDSLMQRPEDWVEISEGMFHLFARPEYAEMTRRAARTAVDSLTRSLGSAAGLAPQLDAIVSVTERWRPDPNPSPLRQLVSGHTRDLAAVYQLLITPERTPRNTREKALWYATRSEVGSRNEVEPELTGRFIEITNQAMDRLVPWEMRGWTGLDLIRPAGERFDYRAAYRTVVIAPYRVSQACFAGDDTACLPAFGFDSAGAWREWYRGDDLRALVRGISVDRPLHPVVRNLYERCLAGEFADCGTFIEAEYRNRQIGRPLADPVRASLLQVAFATGGEDAYRRFLEAQGTVTERLEATAGVPLNTLLREWRRTLHEAAGRPVTTPFRTGLLALTWTLVFAYFGLRSTSWR